MSNNYNQSFFYRFEIIACREMRTYDGGVFLEQIKTSEEFLNADGLSTDDSFYRVFGFYKEKIKGRQVLGDFHSTKSAKKFIQNLVNWNN